MLHITVRIKMDKLCGCGCGAIVNNPLSNFIRGHSNKCKEIKLKKQLSYLNHYGVLHSMKTNQIKQKVLNTTLSKYGGIGFQDSKLKTKYRNTMLNRYGVSHNSQLPEYNEKVKQTCFKKYGVIHSNQSENIKQKKRKTCLEHYGVENPNQSEEIQEKKKKTCLEKYGVDNVSKNEEIVKKIRIKVIKRIEKQLSNNEPIMPCIGIKERKFLDELQKYTSYTIIRNDPSFRYTIGRFPDGHIRELKLFIQFDERYHFKDRECTEYRDDDIQCIKDLESISGYRVFRVSEKKWQENQEDIINEFKNLIISY